MGMATLMMNRREALKSVIAAGIGLAAAGKGSLAAMASDTVTLPFANGERPLVAYPGKRPLIRLTTRPPQLETQPPGEGKAFWRAEVQKMIKVYKAPIVENDAAVIVDYLAATY